MTQEIWKQFLTIAREEVGTRVVETWFKAIVLERWDSLQNQVFLKVPNQFVQDWLKNHYISLLQLHLGRLLNLQQPTIVFESRKKNVQQTKAQDSQNNEIVVLPAKKIIDKRKSSSLTKISTKYLGCLNKKYTFNSFVKGPSNSLAYAAAQAITQKPGILYNPLFIYGESGLGKTHLMHAIGNEILAKYKNVSLLYQTANRFVNEFINAIRFDKIHNFQQKYQKIEVLLIDDIQFFSNKEQTQEAFFHIFNLLYDARKQIVFSSDKFPQDMGGIQERLRSRLGWGLVTDLYVPSLETKVAILKKKAALNNEQLPDEVAHFIASHVKSNIRELEGALIRILAFSTLTKQNLTLEIAQQVLMRSHAEKETIVDFKRITDCLVRYYPYSLSDLRSKNRNKELAMVRHIAMFFMKKLTKKSLRDIGHYLGGRDHSTVMHGLQKVDSTIKEESVFRHKLEHIEKEILNN